MKAFKNKIESGANPVKKFQHMRKILKIEGTFRNQ